MPSTRSMHAGLSSRLSSMSRAEFKREEQAKNVSPLPAHTSCQDKLYLPECA
jgi:hypothetical protein